MRVIKKIVVLGANGTMGSGAGAIFAARGYDVVMLARDPEKAKQGLEDAVGAVRADAIRERIRIGTYDADLEATVAEADFVLECVAERLDIKQTYFARVDAARQPGSVIATVSSGLDIDSMAAGRSDDFRRHFLGVHLFNPPNVIVGTELIPGRETERAVVDGMRTLLEKRLGRVVVETANTPAFAGNRIGFEVLNQCCQLAEQHGVAKIDYLVGPYTGRALAPLATIDLVGWDVHKAIVDNVYANTEDEAHAAFALPAYMDRLIAAGHLGNKTGDKGGFYRRTKVDGQRKIAVLDPASGTYRDFVAPEPVAFVEEMKTLHRLGRYREAAALFLSAEGPDAELARTVILGYVSYGLNRVGSVVERPVDVDMIMGWGFNWAPPTALVDLFGRDAAVAAMKKLGLTVPACVADAAPGARLFTDPNTNIGKYFINR
jgi:3-hydroxyacyl-CoA dehydrogenase